MSEFLQVGPYGVVALVFLYFTNRLNKVENRLDIAEALNHKLTGLYDKAVLYFTEVWLEVQDAADKNEKGDLLASGDIRRIRALPKPEDLEGHQPRPGAPTS